MKTSMRFDLVDLRLFLFVVEAANITHGATRAGIHKQVEAVGRTLIYPLLHKVDNLLRGADEPIMSATASGDNLTNGDGSVLQQTVSRCPVSG